MRELVKSEPVIDVDYEVIEPQPPVQWSFWRDDLPAVFRIVMGGVVTALTIWGVHRLWS